MALTANPAPAEAVARLLRAPSALAGAESWANAGPGPAPDPDDRGAAAMRAALAALIEAAFAS